MHNVLSIHVTRLASFALLFGFLALTSGCGEKNWSYVEGNVQFDGKVFGPGVIHFQPAGPSKHGGAVGEIDASGHYVAKSSGRREGLASGEYLIAITDELLVGGNEQGGRESSVAPLPSKYKLTSTSGITRTIDPGKQVLDFTLDP